MEIDFTKKENLLNEDYLRAVGSWTKWLLGRMFGDDLKINAQLSEEEETKNANFIIRGKYQDVKAYAMAIGKEKDYIVAYTEHGKEHPITAKAKAELDQASNHFTRLTGVEWPFK